MIVMLCIRPVEPGKPSSHQHLRRQHTRRNAEKRRSVLRHNVLLFFGAPITVSYPGYRCSTENQVNVLQSACVYAILMSLCCAVRASKCKEVEWVSYHEDVPSAPSPARKLGCSCAVVRRCNAADAIQRRLVVNVSQVLMR